MPMFNAEHRHHSGTPHASVSSSRGHPVLELSLLRQPGESGSPRLLRSRVQIQPEQRSTSIFGARPLRATPEATLLANATSIVTLGGQVLAQQTVDDDRTLSFNDIAGQPLWKSNAQGTATRTLYTSPEEGGRPQAVLEQPCAGAQRQRERLRYGLADAPSRLRNLAGQLIEHHDNAGVTTTAALSLTSQPLETQRRLLQPSASQPDWAQGSEDELEQQQWSNIARHNALGELLRQTDATGVITHHTHDLSGEVCHTILQHDKRYAVLLDTVQYRADGKMRVKITGNGVVQTWTYSQRSNLLSRHHIARPVDHPLGPLSISDLHYHYDPIGNITVIDDMGAAPGWHDNQHITARREFNYDSLQRLTCATGRERASVTRFAARAFARSDRQGGTVWTRYTEHFSYDDGDNLTRLSHNGGAGSRTRHLKVAANSNRALPKDHPLTPEQGFLAGGLQKQLDGGRPLIWQADNQLHQVVMVERPGEDNDTEHYHYASGGVRSRKVNRTRRSNEVALTVTTYVQDCEVRIRMLEGQEQPRQHIAISQIQEVRWISDRTNERCYLRYAFSDHQNNVGGETDEQGLVVSREEYAPFGATTGVDEDGIEVDSLQLRTHRYSGKELDASGLYYFGWRYYLCAFGRWLSADPAGLVDGLNLFCMVGNNPVNRRDPTGLAADDPLEDARRIIMLMILAANGLTAGAGGYSLYSLQLEPTTLARNAAEGSPTPAATFWRTYKTAFEGNNGRLSALASTLRFTGVLTAIITLIGAATQAYPELVLLGITFFNILFNTSATVFTTRRAINITNTRLANMQNSSDDQAEAGRVNAEANPTPELTSADTPPPPLAVESDLSAPIQTLTARPIREVAPTGEHIPLQTITTEARTTANARPSEAIVEIDESPGGAAKQRPTKRNSFISANNLRRKPSTQNK